MCAGLPGGAPGQVRLVCCMPSVTQSDLFESGGLLKRLQQLVLSGVPRMALAVGHPNLHAEKLSEFLVGLSHLDKGFGLGLPGSSPPRCPRLRHQVTDGDFTPSDGDFTPSDGDFTPRMTQ
eukprot:1182157-Prorocentrum_minimum.AAC.1